MCSAIRCRSCVPQAPGTPHSRAYTHIVLHQNTHTHSHKDIHTEVCMTMSRPTIFSPALPLTLRGCLRSRVAVGRVGGSSQGLPYPSGHSPTIPSSIKIWSGLQGPHQPTSSKKPSYHMPNPPLLHSIHHHITSQAS